jgi:hypothetical protein
MDEPRQEDRAMTDSKPSATHETATPDNIILRFAEALDRSIAQRRRDLGLEPVPSLLFDLNTLMKKKKRNARAKGKS